MIRNARPIGVIVGIAAGALALVGCGSDSYSNSNSNSSTASVASQASTAATEGGKGDYGGYSSDPATSSPETEAASGAAGLTIKGFSFSPLTVTAGEAFQITNEDSANHTVTADDGSFSVSVPAGSTAELTIPTAGSYAIHCEIHSSMKGTIVVN